MEAMRAALQLCETRVAAPGVPGTVHGESGFESTGAGRRSLTRIQARGDWTDGETAMPEEGFTPLFDGATTRNWEMVGSGHFVVVDGRLESVPGSDLGLFWCVLPMPPDFVLRLRWLRWRHEDCSGIFIRFPRPRADVAHPAVLATRGGFEVQIDEVGIPGATSIHRTGAIFNEPDQEIIPHPARPAAEWNDFEIAAHGQQYSVRLNDRLVTSFVNRDLSRGIASTVDTPSFIGLQVSPGSRVAFRNIRMRPL